MKTHEPGIDHFFDIWHISKSVKKKLTAASKRAGCQDLEIWIQTATNHMYWSARAAGGNKKLLIDIWLNMHNHVINKHSGHEGTYGRCLHGDMPEPTRPWMNPSMFLFFQLKSITGNKTAPEGPRTDVSTWPDICFGGVPQRPDRLRPKVPGFQPRRHACK
ncbi:unnamed protein product, partial [Ixodes pacificus]